MRITKHALQQANERYFEKYLDLAHRNEDMEEFMIRICEKAIKNGQKSDKYAYGESVCYYSDDIFFILNEKKTTIITIIKYSKKSGLPKPFSVSISQRKRLKNI